MPRPSRPALLLAPVLAATTVLALASPALAHATLDKASVPASSEQALQARVPVELAGGYNVKVIIEVPRTFVALSCADKLGWTCTVKKEDSPERSAQITWTRQSGVDAIDLLDFVVRTPARPGTYPVEVNQLYSNGEVAQWDDAPGGEKPAPQLTVTASGTAPSANPEATPHSGGKAAPAATRSPAPARPAGTSSGEAAPAPAAAEPGSAAPAAPAPQDEPAVDAAPAATQAPADSTDPGSTDPGSSDVLTEIGTTVEAGAPDLAALPGSPGEDEGSNPLLWALPLVLLAGGGGAVLLRRRASA